jgi:hypothetical protein
MPAGGVVMNLKLEFDVTVTRHESGAYLAGCDDFPRKVGIGDTPEEALADLRARVLRPVLQPIRPPAVGVPWYLSVPPLPDDELTAEWKRIIQERRDVYEDAEPERG